MTDYDDDVEPFHPLAKLHKDILKAAATLTDHEVRFLVDSYYRYQENRKRALNQRATLEGVPNSIFEWTVQQEVSFEKRMQTALDAYTAVKPIGIWLRAIKGIGPVIAAGLISHIDINKAPTVGHIWQFAGIAGSGQTVWKPKTKRPFNVKLKTLCWKAGQSFMKLSNDPECYYGKVYRERKAYEIARNDAGELAEQAAAGAARVAKSTEAYKHYSDGKLPPGHIDARARRYAVKLFLAHFHEELYRTTFGKEPPLPYAIAFLNHAHKKVA